MGHEATWGTLKNDLTLPISLICFRFTKAPRAMLLPVLITQEHLDSMRGEGGVWVGYATVLIDYKRARERRSLNYPPTAG